MTTLKSARAVTLMEMIIVCGIVTIALGATLRVISSVQSLRDRSADITSLTLRANAELEKLKVKPFDEITPGKHPISPLPSEQSGEISVTEIQPGKLKQITVTIRTFTARDSDELSFTTMLAKPITR
jgi:hypothetical protein